MTRDPAKGLRWLGVLAAITACVILLRRIDSGLLLRTLSGAHWERVALAAALNLVLNTAARTFRFQAFLERLPGPSPRPPNGEILALILSSRALGIVLPARAGEVYRILQLHWRHGYAIEGLAAAVLLESFSDAISLAIPATALLALPSIPLFASRGLRAVVLIALLGLVLLRAWMRLATRRNARPLPPHSRGEEGLRSRIRSSLMRLHEAIHRFRSFRLWSRAIGWTLLADGIDTLTIGLCLGAVGIPSSLSHWFLILVTVNIAILLPTPGNLGTLEAGAVLTLALLGVPREPALAFALLYHAAHLLPVTLAGSLFLLISRKRRAARGRSPPPGPRRAEIS